MCFVDWHHVGPLLGRNHPQRDPLHGGRREVQEGGVQGLSRGDRRDQGLR